MSTTTTIAPAASPWTSAFAPSASCQQLHDEDFTDPQKAKVTVRSCLQDPDLWPAIGMHKCNGVALCPSGLYGDMAVQVAQHIWRRNRWPNAELPGLSVRKMHIEKPIIANPPGQGQAQWIEMEGICELPEASSGDIIDATIHCHIRSVNGSKLQDLAYCAATYEWMPGCLDEWVSSTASVKNKIASLYKRASTNPSSDVTLMNRETSYRLFRSFVDYGPLYQNMAEVVCDSQNLEGTAKLDFQPDPQSPNNGPYYLDGSCHLSGFICNAVEQDKDKNAYVSHGWEAMKMSNKFRPARGADIRSYVQMKAMPNDKTVLCGDVYVLQDDDVVGVWEGVQFKRIPRRVLNIFLPPPKKG